MSDEGPLRAIGESGVVAIFRLPSADGLVEACRALRDNGIRAVEITLTIPGALTAIEAVAREVGGSLAIGAGTVLDVADARAAVSAGATFVVSPGLDATVLAECARLGVLALPGALTPTEVMTALRGGAAVVKLFPARVATPEYLADLLGPLPAARLMPTGGIDGSTAGRYISAGAFAVGVGGQLVAPEAVRRRDAEAIGRAAQDLLSTVQAARAARAARTARADQAAGSPSGSP